MQVTHILLRIEHTKPLPDLLDLAAGRVYTLSGVSNVTAGLVEDEPKPSPYGFCPTCGAPGIARERRPNGNTRCKNGHDTKSSEMLTQPKEIQK